MMIIIDFVTSFAFIFGFTSCVKEYSDALEKSLLFYQAQRSGRLGPGNKIPWRRDSHVEDKGEDGEDLSGMCLELKSSDKMLLRGGYYDAGDYIKFGFPLAFSLSLLSWGGLEFTAGYEDSGLMGDLEDTVR